MSTIVTRVGKGSPLTWTEVDSNFTNLNTDKLQSGNTAASLTITSATINGGTITGITDLAVADGGTGLSSLTAGYIPFGAGTSAFGSSANLFWDSANNYLGIGTTSPLTLLNLYNSTSAGLTIQSDAAVFVETQRYSTNATSGFYMIRKARGTLSSPSAVASSDVAGEYLFGAYGGTTNRTVGRIRTTVDTYTSDTDISSYMSFFTNNTGTVSPTEKMRITSAGNVLVGTTTTSLSSSVNGAIVYSNGGIDAYRSGSTVALFNRNTNDGTIVSLRQADVEEGTISVSGTTVSYNGGHLSRWSQFDNETEKPEVYRGTVLESVNTMCVWEKNGQPLPNEQATKTIVSNTPSSKTVAGVFDRYDEDDEDNPYDFYVAQSGDFVIRIAQGVTVQNGDLLESAGDGTARPQADDICRSSTIAKVTSNYVSATYEDGSYCVPCILMIG